MAKLTHEEILAYLEEATILELNDLIEEINKETNTIGAERLMRENFADISDTTILRMIKKTNTK